MSARDPTVYTAQDYRREGVGGAGATSGCEIGHTRVPAAAKGCGKGMAHQIGDSEGKGLWGTRYKRQVLLAEWKWNIEAELFSQKITFNK